MFRTLLACLLTVLFGSASFAANGYQATAAWWNQVQQNVSQNSLLLQNLYAEVEAQVGPDKSRLTQAFAKRLAQQYPGSIYSGNIGTLAINNYTRLTFDDSWRIVAARQNFGSLQKTCDFRNLTAEFVNGPNRVTFKLDERNIERSQFTSVDIPAITVTARSIWLKKGDSRGVAQPLKDILNDAYSNQIAVTAGTGMDKLAEEMVSNDAARQQVLSIANALYSGGMSKQVVAAGEGQSVTPIAQSSQSSSVPSLFSMFPWYFWPAFVLIGAGSVVAGSRRKRRPQKPTAWSPPRNKYDGFAIGRQQPSEYDFSPPDPLPPAFDPIILPETKPKEWSRELLSSLEWKRFETVCAEYLRFTGYDPRETRIGADGGIDIWVYKPGIDKPVGIVQCKAWNTYKVGVKPVRELLGVMAASNIANGKFMTSGEFTEEALAFAAGNRLELISGERFLRAIMKLPEDKRQALLEIAIEGDYRTPTCPQCGVKMTLRRGGWQKKEFWGCPRYPRCKAKLFCKAEV